MLVTGCTVAVAVLLYSIFCVVVASTGDAFVDFSVLVVVVVVVNSVVVSLMIEK